MRGDTDVLNRELQGRIEMLSTSSRSAASSPATSRRSAASSRRARQEASVTNIVETELVAAYQTLTAEMQRLLKDNARGSTRAMAVGGIPVDSEWIIFIIDTSGSMQTDNWENAQQVMKEILDIYPR